MNTLRETADELLELSGAVRLRANKDTDDEIVGWWDRLQRLAREVSHHAQAAEAAAPLTGSDRGG